jgi:hypothetical protein
VWPCAWTAGRSVAREGLFHRHTVVVQQPDHKTGAAAATVNKTLQIACWRYPSAPARLFRSLHWAVADEVLRRRWFFIGNSHVRYLFTAIYAALRDVQKSVAGANSTDITLTLETPDPNSDLAFIRLNGDVIGMFCPTAIPNSVDLWRCLNRNDTFTSASVVTDVFTTTGAWEVDNVYRSLPAVREGTSHFLRNATAAFPNAHVVFSLPQWSWITMHGCASPLRQRVMRDAIHGGIIDFVTSTTTSEAVRSRVITWNPTNLTVLRRRQDTAQTENSTVYVWLPHEQPNDYRLSGVDPRLPASRWMSVGDGRHLHPPVLLSAVFDLFRIGSLRRAIPIAHLLSSDAVPHVPETTVPMWSWSGTPSSEVLQWVADQRTTFDRDAERLYFPSPPLGTSCEKCFDRPRFSLYTHQWCRGLRAAALTGCSTAASDALAPPPGVGKDAALVWEGREAQRCARDGRSAVP